MRAARAWLRSAVLAWGLETDSPLTVLATGQHWDRSEEVAVPAEDSCRVPKCSTCRCVRFAEAGEVEPGRGHTAEVAVVGAAQSTVRGQSWNAEARKGWKIAAVGVVAVGSAADKGFAGRLSLAGSAENMLLETQWSNHS